MQTAFGRCGTVFAFDYFGVIPDMVCIGKAFGGGMLPISAVLGTEAVWGSLVAMPSTFGSSLGGNPLACRAALEVLDIATCEPFLEQVRAKGQLIGDRLDDLTARYPGLIRAHRGVGMMHGLDFHDQSLGGLVLRLMLERQITSTYSLYNDHVLRVQPPMVISIGELAHGLEVIEDVMAVVESYREETRDAPLLPPVTMTVRVHRTPAEIVQLLHLRPRLMDPFAMDPDADADAELAEEFAGTLGDDLVQWPDRLERDSTGVSLFGLPSWLWRKLERTARVRPDEADPDTSLLDVRVDWDAGTGPYEGLLAGRLRYFVTRRLAAQARNLRTLTETSSRGHAE
jgi:putrescine aminotransferase